MRFLAQYWWFLILPVVVYVWVRAMRRTTRGQWVFLLRLFGVLALVGTGTWLVTGDIDQSYLSLRLEGGWPGVLLGFGVGLAALFGAQRLARRRGPPA